MRVLRMAALVAAFAATAAAQVQKPLEASLRRGAIEALFAVDQPAYVAVFEAIPGQGIQQLFPRSSYQAERAVDPGEYLLSRPFRSQYSSYGWYTAMPYARPVYMLDATGRIEGYYYTTGWSGPYGSRGRMDVAPTRTLLMVASRLPLRLVESPDAARHWLQQVVGFRALSFSVTPPQALLDDIVAAILPAGAGIDDVVVDVLELTEADYGWQRMASQSVTFRCPGGGVYQMRAEFFFGSGDFWCPTPRVALSEGSTPLTPSQPSVDTSHIEGVRSARRVPSKTDVANDPELVPRGARPRPATPTSDAPVMPVEDYHLYTRRRHDGGRDDGVRAYGRGVGTIEAPSHATFTVGLPPLVEGVRSRGVVVVTGAYVPPVPGGSAGEGGYRSGRPTDGPYRSSGGAQSSGGYNAGGTMATSTNATASSAASGSSAANATSTSTPAQAAQSARSSAHSAEVKAAKPNPNPDL